MVSIPLTPHFRLLTQGRKREAWVDGDHVIQTCSSFLKPPSVLKQECIGSGADQSTEQRYSKVLGSLVSVPTIKSHPLDKKRMHKRRRLHKKKILSEVKNLMRSQQLSLGGAF
jgi:hypothetical protein